jgi:hypothetical protein
MLKLFSDNLFESLKKFKGINIEEDNILDLYNHLETSYNQNKIKETILSYFKSFIVT